MATGTSNAAPNTIKSIITKLRYLLISGIKLTFSGVVFIKNQI